MKSKILIAISAVGLLIAGSVHSAPTVLIDFDDGIPDNGVHEASVRNGGFEEGANNQTFAQTPVWSSYFSPDGDSSTLTFNTNVKTGALRGTASGFSGNGTRQQPSITIPASAWTIAAGDVFNVSVDWRNGAAFTVGTHQLQVILHVVDANGNLVGDPANGEFAGDRLLSRNDSLATAGQYQTFSMTSNPVPAGSPWIGNRIQIRILNSGARTSFAIIDNVSLTATPLISESLTWVGLAGGGTWDIGTTAHWKDAAENPATFKNLDIVSFDDTAATGLVALVDPEIEPSSATFANDTLPYTLSGEAWSGVGSLVKNGAEDVTLLIDNNLASTTINAGTLRIGNGGLDGSPGTGPIINDAALIIARDGTVEISGGISGNGTLGIEGPGTTVLTGVNSYTGATSISGGTLRAVGALESPVTVQSGGTLAPGPVSAPGTLELPALSLQTGSATTFRAGFSSGDQINVSSVDGLAINGSHSINLVPNELWLPSDEFPLFVYDTSYTGSVANLQIGSAPHGSYTIEDRPATGEIIVRVDSLDSLIWKGNHNSIWDVNSTANWQLQSNNATAPFFAYDQVRFDGSATNTTVTVAGTIPVGDMTFDFAAPVAYLLDGSGTLTGTGLLFKNNTGTLTIATTLANIGATNIAGGALVVGNGGSIGSLGGGAINNNGSLAFNREDNLTVTNAISGDGTLTQQGTGNLTLGGATANTFTGDVTVASGRLTLAKATALGTSADGAKTVTVAAGASLNFNNYTGLNVDPNRSYSFRIAGNGDGTGALVNNGGTNIASAAGVLNFELTGDATIGGTARYDIGFANGTPGLITGNGHTLTKISTNQVTMRGDGSASPISIIINEGILSAEGHDNSLGGATGAVTVNEAAVLGAFGPRNIPTPITLNSGAILRSLGGNVATWSGAFTLAGNAFINTPSFDKIINGVIGGTGGITKTGGNALTLTAVNDYTGPTTVSEGRLIIQHPCLAESSAITVAATAILDLDFTGTNVIGALTIAGNTLVPGIYDANTHPGRLAGTGKLQVVASASDYDDWAGPAGFNLSGGPSDDDDFDGLANFDEYAFGLDPTSGASASPVTAPDKSAGTFTYTRRKPSLTGLNYIYQSSTTLAGWAPFTPVSEGTDNGDPVETITVTLPGTLLTEPKLFLQVEASEP